MGMLHGTGTVNDGQQDENHGLNERDKDTQAEDRQRPEEGACQQKENGKQSFFCHDITEKPDGKREDPGNTTDEFDGQHERNKPPHRTHEVFYVPETMIFQP